MRDTTPRLDRIKLDPRPDRRLELFVRYNPETATGLETWLIMGRDELGEVEFRKFADRDQFEAAVADLRAGKEIYDVVKTAY